MPQLKQTAGYRYYQDTVFDREQLMENSRPHINATETFKTYPQAKTYPLPSPDLSLPSSFWNLLQARRSCRRYDSSPMTNKDISQLLWACQGITGQAGNFFFRTAPSAGALYPLETYVALNKCQDIPVGLYHFNIRDFCLEQLEIDPQGEKLASAAIHQAFLNKASAVFIWSTVFRRNMAKYGDRGMRYICMDAGHICQNLLLAAEAIGRGACPVAAFCDQEINTILGIDGNEESALYMASVG